MKPFFDSAQRPVDPPMNDDPAQPYLDDFEIPEDSFEKEQAKEQALDNRNSSESVPVVSQSQEQLARLQNRKNSHESVVDNQTIFNAGNILKSHRRNGETQYLVKWVGYPRNHATWEPQALNILDKHLLENFQQA